MILSHFSRISQQQKNRIKWMCNILSELKIILNICKPTVCADLHVESNVTRSMTLCNTGFMRLSRCHCGFTNLILSRNKHLDVTLRTGHCLYAQISHFHSLSNLDITEQCKKLLNNTEDVKSFIKRYKSKKKSSYKASVSEESDDSSSDDSDDDSSDDDDSDEESSDDEYFDDFPEDSHIPSEYKQLKAYLNNPRCDAILRKALDIKSTEAQKSFLGGRVYLNNKKVMKKSMKVNDGDYIDIVVESTKDDIKKRRVRILKVFEEKTKKGKAVVLYRVWRHPYLVEKESEWTSTKN